VEKHLNGVNHPAGENRPVNVGISPHFNPVGPFRIATETIPGPYAPDAVSLLFKEIRPVPGKGVVAPRVGMDG
jgi:hypothetical protein